MMRNAMKAGFTLVELLVTLILLGILTAIVFPIVVQQIDDAEPTRVANDLANIKTGIEVFHLNVRPTWPGDLEDLAFQIDGSDLDVEESSFSNLTTWKGPYIDAAMATGNAVTGDKVTTGFNMSIQAEVVCYNESANTFQPPATATVDCVAGTDFIALLMDGSTTFSDVTTTATTFPAEFTAVDKLIDNDGTGWDIGKVRLVKVDGTVLDATPATAFIAYLVAPYTN